MPSPNLDRRPRGGCRSPRRWLVGALVLAAATSAWAQKAMRGDPQAGRLLYHSTALGTNGLACIHCHADFDEAKQNDGRIRSGHPLYDAADRETFWGQEVDDPDRYPDIAHAAVVCVEHYLRNPQKLTAQQLLDLQAYLRAIAKRPSRAALAIAPAADHTGTYAGFEDGDRIRGRTLFYAACHTCHPNGNAGIAPAPIPRDQPPPFHARKVREGDGLGSVLSGLDPNAYDPEGTQYMPFFGADRLTNQDLRDIIAFIRSLPPVPPR